jgi:hypothetical protein
MGKIQADGGEAGSLPDVLPLAQEKKLRKLYYSGASLPSPMGGTLELISVHFGGSRAGAVLFECLTSSLRFELTIPRATTGEREAVRKKIKAKRDPFCPRHGEGARLVRMGKSLVCRRCGISFGQAG